MLVVVRQAALRGLLFNCVCVLRIERSKRLAEVLLKDLPQSVAQLSASHCLLQAASR